MKNAVAKEHRDFFQKEGWIEFEGIFTPAQINQYNSAIDEALSQRLKVTPAQLSKISSEKIFLQSRDLWRSSDVLRKLICHPKLAEIAVALTDQRLVRLGYDQLLPAPPMKNVVNEQIYAPFLQKKVPLDDISCVKGLIGGVLIPLSPAIPESSDQNDGPDLFSTTQGNVIIVSPTGLIDLKNLYRHPGSRYYLIVYADAFATYCMQPNDPQGSMLKSLGYVYNDKLLDRLHPIIYRS